jgi:hypothetical protein
MKVMIIFISFFIELSLSDDYIIQWTTQNSSNQRLDLIQKFSSKIFCLNQTCDCDWWKLVENSIIPHDGEEYFYGTSRTECRLVIKEFNLNKHLELYKPINKRLRQASNKDDPVFMIGYFKSLTINEVFIDDNITEYSCNLEVIIPNILNDEIQKSVLGSLETFLSLFGNKRLKPNELFSKNLKKKKMIHKRNTGHNILTITEEFMFNKSNLNDKTHLLECIIKLYENKRNKKVFFEAKAVSQINFKNHTNPIMGNKINYLLIIYLLLVIFYFNFILSIDA